MSPQQSGEKTEKATPKKKREARERGQVFKSIELVTAFSLMVMFGALAVFGAGMADGLKKLISGYFGAGDAIPDVMTVSAAGPLLARAFTQMGVIMLPMLGAALVGGLVFNYLQVGFLFSSKALAPKMDRISISSGFKRIFSKRTLIDLLKSIIKITVLGAVAYSEFEARIKDMPMMMGQNIFSSIQSTVDILLGVAFKLAIALAILAPFDFLYQWWKYQKDLMMTKQEVRDEYKLTEGDPQIKGKIRQKQRQMASMRMMQAVADADVVITNPTHYAVALEYKEEKNSAPVVLAKGKDYIARKIREKAQELHIEIVENKPVAQYLYFFCEIGDEVPEDMYQAVAEILAYVYRLKQRMRGVR